jgi:DNA-binding NtrC family response regulator
MNLDIATRVLVIGDDPSAASLLAGFLTDKHYEVVSCGGLDSADEALAHWRPHVMVLMPKLETRRHESLEALRKHHPRLPIVVVTRDEGPDLLLDLEAFAPAMPARHSIDFSSVESAVAAASLFN